MTSPSSLSLMTLLTVLGLGAAPLSSGAQESARTREGNTWDWRHHEPDPSVVHRDEQTAGVDPSAAQQERATDDVESLYSEIMKNTEDR
jgi:hypothetical protein